MTRREAADRLYDLADTLRDVDADLWDDPENMHIAMVAAITELRRISRELWPVHPLAISEAERGV